MAKSDERLQLRRRLAAHLADLGYTSVRLKRVKATEPELVRVSPTRGHLAFGETVVGTDLKDADCHKRLVQFSLRRTRHRSTILFFIGVVTTDRAAVVALLERLDIRSNGRGGHVHVVPFELASKRPPQAAATPKRAARAAT